MWYEIEELEEGYFLHIYDDNDPDPTPQSTQYFNTYQDAKEKGESETR